MFRVLAWCLGVAMALGLAACDVSININTQGAEKLLEVRSGESSQGALEVSGLSSVEGGGLSGRWSGDCKPGKTHTLSILVPDSQTKNTIWLSAEEIFGTDSDESAQDSAKRIRIEREAGVLELNYGAARIANLHFSEQFSASVERQFGQKPTTADSLQAFLYNLRISDLDTYGQCEAGITLEDVFQLRRNGVSGADVKQFRAARADLSTADMIELRRNGVPPDFVETIGRTRPELPAEDFVTLRRNGVPADYVAHLDKSEFACTTGEIVNLRRNGVPAEYPADLRKAGYELDTDAIIDLRRNGVPLEYMTALRQAGYQLDMREIVDLRRNGVPVDFLTEIRAASYDLPPDKLIELRRHGVPADYLAKAKSLGYNLTVEEAVDLRRNGVSTGYLEAIRVEGKETLPVAAIIDLHRRGIPAETVRSLRQ